MMVQWLSRMSQFFLFFEQITYRCKTKSKKKNWKFLVVQYHCSRCWLQKVKSARRNFEKNMENVWLRISWGRYGCCSSNGISGTDDGGGVVPKSVSAQNRLATSFYTLLSTMYVMWCLLFSVYYYYFYIFFIFFLFYLFFSCFLEHHSFLLKIVGSLLVKLSICLQSPYLP